MSRIGTEREVCFLNCTWELTNSLLGHHSFQHKACRLQVAEIYSTSSEIQEKAITASFWHILIGYLQLGHTQTIFWIEFLRSSRKAFSGNRATSLIFYIGSPTGSTLEVMDNSPRTYPRTNPKHNLGVD